MNHHSPCYSVGRTIWFVALFVCGMANPSSGAEPARHLFLDPAFIQEAKEASLHVNPARQREIVIRPDKPWEQLMISFYLTVRDEGGKIRMWYLCRDAANRPNVAYAESSDGVNWVKPNLGIVEYQGSKENNLVGLSIFGGVIFRDPKAQPGEEFVYVGSDDRDGVIRFTSPDGLHWRRDAQPLLPFRADTQNVTFWDERLKCYVLYLRGWDVGEVWNARLRKVVRLTLNDLSKPADIKTSGRGVNPTRASDMPRIDDEIPTVMAADERDPRDTDVYNISAQPYPLDTRWYVGFPSFFQRERGISDGRLEVQFAGSRDGIVWNRYDRKAYAPPGLAESESANMVFMSVGMVVRGDEIWQYATGFNSRHGDVQARKRHTDGVIYRYVQRVDGFVSMDFANAEAKCVTKPVKVDGAQLLLNVDTGAMGKMRVALLDSKGSALPGFAAEDCDVIRINSTRQRVSWKGASDLSGLNGTDVQVVFEGSRAKLYSFRFESQPAEATPPVAR